MAKPLSKTQRTDLEASAWALSQQGWSQPRIARHHDVDQGTVSRALAKVRKRASEKLDEDAKLWLVTLLEQLEHVADEALQAWERSKKPKKKASRKSGLSVVGTDGETTAGQDQTMTEIVEREGEPGFLNAYFGAIDRIRTMLNLDARTIPRESVTYDGDTPSVRDALAEAEAADAAYRPDPPSEAHAP